jgi:hypothetical protein
MNPLVTKRCSPIEEAIYQDGFQAGAASRGAEIAELVAALEHVIGMRFPLRE